MLKRVKLEKLDEYFLELRQRREKGVFFYRIPGFHEEIRAFLPRYYEEAMRNGGILEGRIPNPDQRQLAYFQEILGMDFQMRPSFLEERLARWLPRMGSRQRVNVAAALYDALQALRQSGKNDHMLKNAYVKFMCWLYYKFERIVNRLGEERLPKILCEGELGNYEFLLLDVLSLAGADIVLLEYQGDAAYRRLDPSSARSFLLELPGMGRFPEGYSLRQIRQGMQEEAERERLYGTKPRTLPCTNAWIGSGSGIFSELEKAAGERGQDPRFYYNCFCRITGVEDKFSYQDSLYRLQLTLRNAGRKLVIVNGGIPAPDSEEIAGIRRGNNGEYQNLTQLVLDLSTNFRSVSNLDLQALLRKAFVDLLLEEGKKAGVRLHRLYNQAVLLLCWLKRYQGGLFAGWHPPEIAGFFYMGGCRNENEALFCRFLARLPVDVVLFCPDLEKHCCLEDPLLYELHYPQSLPISRYPEEDGGLRAGTAAYHAERELDSLLYQDSGLYRRQQYQKANALSLQAMYEEIPILWDQEVKYRPGFGTTGELVTIPVFFAKISGVKDGMVQAYWGGIKKLLTEDTLLCTGLPLRVGRKLRVSPAAFFRNGKLQRRAIKEHPDNPYAFLREPMQDHLLDKIELLIRQRAIKGTFENGTEYTIVSTALGLDRALLRMLQSFDFTRKNPKLVVLLTGETALSLEDSILAAFLHLVGFDILFFVPTGYQCVERFFQADYFEEQQIGTYLYDLQVPDFAALPALSAASHFSGGIRQGIKDFFFGTGR